MACRCGWRTLWCHLQGRPELYKQKHQEMIRTSGNAKLILVSGSDKGQILVLRIRPWHPHVDTAETLITRFDTLAVYTIDSSVINKLGKYDRFCELRKAILDRTQAILLILRRWRGLRNLHTKFVLTVRNAKFGSSKGPHPPIAQKLCITHSGTAHWLCVKIRAFDPLNN
jgi:hypothetical protein